MIVCQCGKCFENDVISLYESFMLNNSCIFLYENRQGSFLLSYKFNNDMFVLNKDMCYQNDSYLYIIDLFSRKSENEFYYYNDRILYCYSDNKYLDECFNLIKYTKENIIFT